MGGFLEDPVHLQLAINNLSEEFLFEFAVEECQKIEVRRVLDNVESICDDTMVPQGVLRRINH